MVKAFVCLCCSRNPSVRRLRRGHVHVHTTTVAVSSRVMSRRMMGRDGNLRIPAQYCGLSLVRGPCLRRVTLSLGFLRTRPTTPAPPATGLQYTLRPLFLLSRRCFLDRASAAELCHAIRRRNGRHPCRLAAVTRLRLWRLSCMDPTHSLRKPND